MELSKITNMNKYAIKLIEKIQLFSGLIYTLSPVEQETLKVYIKTHLKTEFI